MARTLEWSYDLLSPSAREVFDRLSVFPAGFDLDAAERIAAGSTTATAEVADRVDELVDHSMLVVDVAARAPYRMFETMRGFWTGPPGRQWGAASGGAAVRPVLVRAGERGAADGMRGRDEATWRDVIDVELNNLRAADVLMVDDGDVDGALGLPVTLYEYAFSSLRPEIGDWAATALGVEGAAASPAWADGQPSRRCSPGSRATGR